MFSHPCDFLFSLSLFFKLLFIFTDCFISLEAPLPRRNPPRVSHRESSARPSKKRAVEADSESETVPDDPAASDAEEPSEASEEEPSPKNTDVSFPF